MPHHFNQHIQTKSALSDKIAALIQGHDQPLSREELQGHLHILKDFLGAASSDELVLLSSGAEAAAAVYHSVYLSSIYPTGRNQLLLPSSEDPHISIKLKQFEKIGSLYKEVALSESGQVTKEAIEAAISPRTSLVSLSWANNITGVINPIWDIASLCQEKGVLLHVDASAAVGKIFFRFQDLGIDYLTLDAKSLGAPCGGGLLLMKERSPFWPLVECAHPPRLLATTMSYGAQTLLNQSEETFFETIRNRDFFEARLKEAIPQVQPLFSRVDRLPHISVVAFPGIFNESLLFALAEQGIEATIGGGDRQWLSATLTATGLNPIVAQSALSFGFHPEIKRDELNAAVAIIASCVQKLRTLAGEASL